MRGGRQRVLLMAENATAFFAALGDPVPRFSAQLLTGGPFDLHVCAGRWVVLSFLGAPDKPKVDDEISALLRLADILVEDHIVVRAIFTSPPTDTAKYAALSSAALSFVADYDGTISRRFGALDMPRTIVLDPMLRAIADIPWNYPQGHGNTVINLVRGLPSVEESAGVPLIAPVLIVPRIFDFPFCDLLIDFYEKNGAEDSGFLFDVSGKTTTIVDHRLKRRRDVPIAHPDLRALVRKQVIRRLLPEIERYFQFQATRMDRDIVACYDSAVGGHFHRHRDNVNAGAQHRRFAVTINLNSDFEGCDLVFPEFGRRSYRAPAGGAIVFSCGALHQVMPAVRGRRYAFLAFLYDEADAVRRKANNTRLHDTESPYDGNWDCLFPELSRETADADKPAKIA